MVAQTWRIWVAAAALVAVGTIAVWPETAAGQMRRLPRFRERCEAVLPEAQAAAIAAKYRDRFAAARDALVREERALRALLVADTSTRAAVEAQMVKTEAARTALSRIRLDYLWELRSIVPAADRGLAFRCARFYLLRRR